MSRPIRIKFEGAWYHVMNRGINRQKIFFNSVHRMAFLKYLEKTVKIYGIEIHAYCLMGNHYHLIVHTPRANISEAIKYLNGSYARYLNVSLKRDGAVFKGRFHAVIVSDDDYLIRLSRYIHRNPISVNKIGSLVNYVWSSYPAYLGKVPAPGWLIINEVIDRFNNVEFISKYKRYVECGDDELNHIFGNDKVPVIGNNDFRERIDNDVKKHSLSVEIVGADRILPRPDIDELVRLVAKYFSQNVAMIRTSVSGFKNPPRNLAIYICRELGGYSLVEIGKFMGDVSYKAISNVIYRVSRDKLQVEVAERVMCQLRCDVKNSKMKKV